MGIQIGGISSGLDTNSLVNELMQAENLKLQVIEQDKILLEKKKEAYTAVNDAYADFVTQMRKIFEVDGTLSTYGYLRPSSTSSLAWMNGASSSSSSVSTTATSTAKPGQYDLEVKQLADTFKAASTKNVSVNPGGTTVAESLGINKNTMINFTITNSKGESVSIREKAGDLSLEDLASQLNELDGISVQYDKDIDRFFINTDEPGATNGITIEDKTLGKNGLLTALNLASEGTQLTSGSYTGKNAIVDFNGATNIEFSSNNFTIQGINVSLKPSSVGEKISINVDTDIDKVVEKVVAFVDAYNDLVENISAKLSETFYSEYPPLTDAQRKELSESEIKLWEEKSNSGLIRNDSVIQRVQSSLREALLAPITLSDGSTVSLADIGITTKNYFNGGKNGALTVDVDKLKATLQKDPNLVKDVLFSVPSDTGLSLPDSNLSASEKQAKFSQNGIFNRITNAISNGIGDIVQRGGLTNDGSKYRAISSSVLTNFTSKGSTSYLDTLLQDKIKRFSDMTTKLAKIETRYWKQFTAMETALSNLQSQQSAFYSNFSSY